MALDKDDLENKLKARIKAVDLLKEDAAASISKIVAEEIHYYTKPLVDAYNQHTHDKVIVTVTGGSGAPAVGTPGNSGTTSNSV
ncbi:hypothetical protein [Persicobacter sp. CCB-QB2]|uniref:hypothetical protein n=1 Tax=Persicobacter sp. CCB-QB2 TaxID=1561025 RepID=UPI0006A9F0E5|nr:hypothetical protein [Persicobacter sp. CCB-QB2]